MAFFKFRLPSQRASSLPESTAASPAESLEVVRQKARFRLIGAAVLVLVAVVGFPLVFDTQPRPVPVDTPIVIPDRQATPGLGAAAPAPAQMPARPLSVPAPAAASATEAASAAPATAVAAASAAAPVAAQAALDPKEEIVSKPALPAASAVAAKPVQTPAAAKTDNGRKDDSARAKALLEGHSKADAKADAAAGDRHVIQVGAYSDADKLREVRRKLEHAGLKTYTQVVDGKDGKRTTRVRLGPFESRNEAEKAAARIRKLDLPANLIKL
jgi:DedD protein